MPRSFTFATITEYKAAKGNSGAIYAELVSSGIKSGSCVSKITATGDVFIDSINPFVTPELGQEGDTLYYSSTEGYRFLRAGNTTWDADSYGQVFIDLAKIPSGFSVVAPYTEIFNFKQTDENIGSGKASMTKILGNTVAWNQLVDMTTWTATRASITGLSAGNATITSTASGDAGLTKSNVCVSGHKIYARAAYKASASGVIFAMYLGSWSGRGFFAETAADTNWHSVSTILRATSGTHGVYVANSVSGQSIQISGLEYIDLTLLYGSSIDGMTDAQILAKFESEFPGYHSYNAGTLISNKAKAIEFVGFNKWDEEWVNGYYNSDGSINDGDSSALRSKNLITVSPGTTYYWHTPYGGRIYFFGADGSFIDRTNTIGDGATFTTPVNCYKIGFNIFSGTAGYVYGNDICINFSGKRNGQYEPYKKVVLPLPNLDQIKVYSHNLYDPATGKAKVEGGKQYYIGGTYTSISQNGTAITVSSHLFTPSASGDVDVAGGNSTDTIINLSSSFNGQYEPHGILTKDGGLKSAGSVRDEIVGNRLIRRLSKTNLYDLGGTWSYSSAYGFYNTTRPSDMKMASGDNVYANILSNRFSATNRISLTTSNNGIALTSAAICCSSTLTDGAAFRETIKDADLIYEIATPIEYEIYSPTKMPFNWKYRVSEYHTKKMLPENGENPTSAPFACEIKQC